MPSTSSVSKTNDATIDGILSGTKWATTSLTYSFPTDLSFYGSGYGGGEPANNFEAFTTTQQTAVRSVLENYASVANLSFTEVTETSTQHGDLRYAESDSPGTAWAYYPSTSAAGGDAWFNNSKGYYDNPVVGNYAYLTMLHETGHALGLKHPHEIRGSFGAEPLDHDSLEYTVMSYRSYIGASTTTGYTNGTYSYPQTLMMLDIAALQDMYGANYKTESGNTVYKWSPTSGEMSIDGIGQGVPGGNKIFMTVWDGGGNDTYDFSNYSGNLTVDLNPGGWTTVSATQLAVLGNGHYAAGNIANALLYHGDAASLIENAIGGSGSDKLIGNVIDNVLTGGKGNDYLDGGSGVDIAVFSGLFANYGIVQNADGTWTVTDLVSQDGVDTLTNIEQLQFADGLRQIGTISTTPMDPVNHAPTITSSAQTVSLAEWADLSTNEVANTAHVASGAITYSDSDATDVHTASFAAQGTGYLGTFSLNTSNIDSAHSIGWSFAVSDSAIDFLKSGQTLTQLYNISINDGHGGTTTETTTITLVGADDAANRAPTVTSSAPRVKLTEWADGSANEVANTAHVASGAITYSDADAGDLHTASFAAQGTGYLGTFSLNTSKIDSAHSIGWSFSVSDSAIDYLKNGQTLTQQYNVSVDDGHGGTAIQVVTITLNGTNDVTKISAAKGHGGNVSAGADPAKHDMHGGHDKHNVESIWDDQAPAPSESTLGSLQADLISVLGVNEFGSDSLHHI